MSACEALETLDSISVTVAHLVTDLGNLSAQVVQTQEAVNAAFDRITEAAARLRAVARVLAEVEKSLKGECDDPAN